MAREKTPTILERLQVFMDDEFSAGKLITYGIASAGLIVALYKIRPFAKFTKPSDVPSQFLQSRVPLQGIVMGVKPSGSALLMVNHQSLLPFPHFNSKSYLPVKIGGINVTNNGISWLQYVVNGKHITFIPLVRDKDSLECIVTMAQKDKDSLKVGEELVKLGLGTLREPWVKLKDKHILAYRKSLASAQKWAEHRRNGYWHFIKQPTIQWKAQMFVIDKIKSLLPTYIVRRLDL